MLVLAMERSRGGRTAAPPPGPIGLLRGARFPVTMAAGQHPFPFRTRQLSPPAPMVLGGRLPGRVGRRRNTSTEMGPCESGGPSPVQALPRPLRPRNSQVAWVQRTRRGGSRLVTEEAGERRSRGRGPHDRVPPPALERGGRRRRLVPRRRGRVRRRGGGVRLRQDHHRAVGHAAPAQRRPHHRRARSASSAGTSSRCRRRRCARSGATRSA